MTFGGANLTSAQIEDTSQAEDVMFVAANSLLTTPVNPEADESNNIFGFQNTANEQEGPHNETPKFKAINYKIMPSKKHKRDWEILLEDFLHQREQVVAMI